MGTLAKYLLPILLLLVFIKTDRAFGLIVFQLGTAISFVYYLYLGTDNRNYLEKISVSIAALPLIELLLFWEILKDELTGKILLYLAAASTTLFYFLRFRSKPDKWSVLEILKLLAVVQLALAYSIDPFEYSRTSILILGFVYLSTRIFQTENLTAMTRSIVIGFLILTCIFFFVFAHIKASEAERQIHHSTETIALREQFMKEKLRHLEDRIDSMQLELQKCQISR